MWKIYGNEIIKVIKLLHRISFTNSVLVIVYFCEEIYFIIYEIYETVHPSAE